MGFGLQVVKCRNVYQWKDSRQRQPRNPYVSVFMLCIAIITFVNSDCVNETLPVRKEDCDGIVESSQQVHFEFSSKVINNGVLYLNKTKLYICVNIHLVNLRIYCGI
jgi:hypothetical protein